MTTTSMARPATGAGPHPRKTHVTNTVKVGPQKLAHALRCIQRGDITITGHQWTTRSGADIHDAVCWAEDHYYLVGDRQPRLTEAAEKWLRLQPPAPAAPLFLAGPEVQ